MSTKHTPKLPALESEPTNDTAALTCYALDWREEALNASRQRDDLLAALESVLDRATAHRWVTNSDEQDCFGAARAAIKTAKGG